MAVDAAALAPGDVLVCRGTSDAAKAIEAGAVKRGMPAFSHVAMYHHDKGGARWGVEGRPGGVGWVDLGGYLAHPATVANTAQPKRDDQRVLACAVMVQELGVPYDWRAIYEDAQRDLGLPELWQEKWDGGAPGMVVCSSLAAYVYGRAGLAAPAGRDPAHIEPGDWGQFIERRAWAKP